MVKQIWGGGPYRSRNRVLLGVVGGLADFLDISVFWSRVLVVIAFLFTGFFPIGVLYIVAALLMKKQPLLPTGCDLEWTERVYKDREKPAGSLDERLARLEALAR